MPDKVKLITAGILLVGALIMPLVGLFYGWWNWNLTTGLVIMTLVFLILLILSGFLLLRIKDLSWVSVFMPYLFGVAYSFLPDSIMYSFDDAAATSVGAIISYALVIRKQPDTPKWVLIPLAAAGIYTIFGGAIPGPGDELVIDLMALVISWLGARKQNLTNNIEGDGAE